MSDDKLDLSGFGGRAPGVAPPPLPSRPAPEEQPSVPEAEVAPERPIAQSTSAKSKATKSSAKKPTGRWAGMRLSVSVPIGVRRWIRTYAKAAGKTHIEVLRDAIEHHGAAISNEPPRVGRAMSEGLKLDFYVTNEDRAQIERIADERGWTMSATVTEMLEREQRSINPEETVAELERQLRQLRADLDRG